MSDSQKPAKPKRQPLTPERRRDLQKKAAEKLPNKEKPKVDPNDDLLFNIR